MKKNLAFLLFSFIAVSVAAQYKYEKEFRIGEAEVPEQAVSFVDSLGFGTKVRWYREVGYDTTSFEAKTRYDRQLYSIEFSATGTFEDVEIGIGANDIPEAAFGLISAYLQAEHGKYKIEKAQMQYLGEEGAVLAYFREQTGQGGLVIHYELVISTKMEGCWVMMEYLFSGTGEFLRRSQLTLKRTDNIIF
ncbi:MAG: hypothetical protein JXB00_02765 [Bacteroidales bacterium]|nr:hypothetical protein [Bacteroidales bacterium]